MLTTPSAHQHYLTQLENLIQERHANVHCRLDIPPQFEGVIDLRPIADCIDALARSRRSEGVSQSFEEFPLYDGPTGRRIGSISFTVAFCSPAGSSRRTVVFCTEAMFMS